MNIVLFYLRNRSSKSAELFNEDFLVLLHNDNKESGSAVAASEQVFQRVADVK